MNRTYRVLLMVLGGLVGGYLGYWIGHWAGWSTAAEWPFRIGGGTGAILMSMALAVIGVLLVGAGWAVPPVLTERRLASHGTRAAATIMDRRSLGLQAHGLRTGKHLYRILVEVRMPDGTTHSARATQWLTVQQANELTPGHGVSVRYETGDPDRVLVEASQQTSGF